MLCDLLLPRRHAEHDRMIDLLRLMPLELHAEITVGLGSTRKYHHAAGGLIQPVDDPDALS